MRKKGALTLLVGLSVLTIQISPVFLDCPFVLSALTAQASTIYSTVTDDQGVTYTIDHNQNTAAVTSYSGAAGVGIVIPDSIYENQITYPVTSIGASAFLNAGISAVIIGDNVTEINTSAFQTTTSAKDFYKSALKEVILGKNVKSIKTDAFSGNALSTIEFPETLTRIGTRAFANNQLTFVSFGARLEEICSKAFQSNLLISVIFDSESATQVDSMAFSGSPVSNLELGCGVILADDALNKISPLFNRLTDLPTAGVRKISVSADGSIKKSWLVTDETQSETNDGPSASLASNQSDTVIGEITTEDSTQADEIQEETATENSVSADSDTLPENPNTADSSLQTQNENQAPANDSTQTDEIQQETAASNPPAATENSVSADSDTSPENANMADSPTQTQTEAHVTHFDSSVLSTETSTGNKKIASANVPNQAWPNVSLPAQFSTDFRIHHKRNAPNFVSNIVLKSHKFPTFSLKNSPHKYPPVQKDRSYEVQKTSPNETQKYNFPPKTPLSISPKYKTVPTQNARFPISFSLIVTFLLSLGLIIFKIIHKIVQK